MDDNLPELTQEDLNTAAWLSGIIQALTKKLDPQALIRLSQLLIEEAWEIVMDPDAQFSKPRQLKQRLWMLWKKESTIPREYSGLDVHIEKRLLMGRVAALIDEVLGLQFSDVAGLPLGGFDLNEERLKINSHNNPDIPVIPDPLCDTCQSNKLRYNVTTDGEEYYKCLDCGAIKDIKKD